MSSRSYLIREDRFDGFNRLARSLAHHRNAKVVGLALLREAEGVLIFSLTAKVPVEAVTISLAVLFALDKPLSRPAVLRSPLFTCRSLPQRKRSSRSRSAAYVRDWKGAGRSYGLSTASCAEVDLLGIMAP